MAEMFYDFDTALESYVNHPHGVMVHQPAIPPGEYTEEDLTRDKFAAYDAACEAESEYWWVGDCYDELFFGNNHTYETANALCGGGVDSEDILRFLIEKAPPKD